MRGLIPDPRDRLCPRCGRVMGHSLTGRVGLDTCGPCELLWFDHQELELLLDDLPPFARPDLVEIAPKGVLEGPALCPGCGLRTLAPGWWHQVPMALCARCGGILLTDPEAAATAGPVGAAQQSARLARRRGVISSGTV